MKKRNLVAVICGVVLLGLGLTAVSSMVFFRLKATLASNAIYQNDQSQQMDKGMRPVTTINGLNRISVVGSTAFIVDGHGKTTSVDPNPYAGWLLPPRACLHPPRLVPSSLAIAW